MDKNQTMIVGGVILAIILAVLYFTCANKKDSNVIENFTHSANYHDGLKRSVSDERNGINALPKYDFSSYFEGDMDMGNMGGSSCGGAYDNKFDSDIRAARGIPKGEFDERVNRRYALKQMQMQDPKEGLIIPDNYGVNFLDDHLNLGSAIVKNHIVRLRPRIEGANVLIGDVKYANPRGKFHPADSKYSSSHASDRLYPGAFSDFVKQEGIFNHNSYTEGGIMAHSDTHTK